MSRRPAICEPASSASSCSPCAKPSLARRALRVRPPRGRSRRPISAP